MTRKKKHGKKQADLAATQRRWEPPGSENLTPGVTPNLRRSEDDFHYYGTQRSHLQEGYAPDEFREAFATRWQPTALSSRELPDQCQLAESCSYEEIAARSRPWPSREPPDQYRPGYTTRASWDAWRPRQSAVHEPHPVTPAYVAGSAMGDSQLPHSHPAHIPKSAHYDQHGISLPEPSRSGTVETRPSRQISEREWAFLRTQPSSTNDHGASSTWRPDPRTPSYTPPSAIPLGVSSSRIQPTNGFTAYQTLRSVQNNGNVAPWRIDEYHRFTHTANTRPAWAEDEEVRIPSPERWTGSVTQRPVPFNLRSNHLETSGILQQRRCETPQPEIFSSRRDRRLKPIPIPKPTAQYLQQANQPPLQSAALRPLLLVVDLNGTLVDRKRRTSSFVERPNLAVFLDYVLVNHTLMIWSSARPDNVRSVCQRLFSPAQRSQVIAEWGRDTLDLTPTQYKEKVQVYKRLDKIWRNGTIQDRHPDAGRGGVWDQSNTVLIDDSRMKAAAQPHNLLQIPEFKNTPEQRDTDVLGQVVGYLEELRFQEDVSRFMREKSFRVDGAWAGPWLE